ncbi:uncharacterized protein EI90DRAFT_2900713 [Cantharellus anzutake]|uniref:uncharacterized protein n=1 Tax=Cantharellus anzutake TaxID=1750568 RepID=UPI0019037A3A|nr:uncharacterized protein EI90DRAFT_2900713 [Cantharellus anzutake]KAF8344220.1 hypothetical protein EI90DRAFT_2900713 [Cantharellus anzutake]
MTLGSAVCKTAVARGWKVTSISSTGKPWTTPKGHSPPWTSKVSWHAASAFDPPTYKDLVGPSAAVVHTLGTLLEGARYKSAVKGSTNPFKAVGALLFGGRDDNPLSISGEERYRTSYRGLNHHSAIRVLDTYIDALSTHSPELSSSSLGPRHFVYVSAEDIFRPLVPRGYIDSKRDAEADIALRVEELASRVTNNKLDLRATIVRPGLLYHPHIRPLTTPLATVLQGSVSVHTALLNSRIPVPSPANVLRALATFSPNSTSTQSFAQTPSPFEPLSSVARALETSPMHVDHVATAIINSIERGQAAQAQTVPTSARFEILGVKEMRDIIGWPVDGAWSGNEEARTTNHTT